MTTGIENNIRVAMMVACKLAPADLSGQRQVIDCGRQLGIFSETVSEIAIARLRMAAVASRHLARTERGPAAA